MRDILRRYKPDMVEELTALNALYRPGPMDMIDDSHRTRGSNGVGARLSFCWPELRRHP